MTPAERWYRRGAELARAECYAQALEPLEQALACSVHQPQLSFLASLRSFYGLTVAHLRGDVLRGRRLCEEAVRVRPMDPELYVNLARVYLRANRRDLAIEAAQTAAALNASHPAASELLVALGKRRPPVFAFLSRSHPINKYAGMIRHRLAG
ncbi:MAG: hypothetical protein JSV80_13210 [Acidobacteriota bacterium]|nr:MAG: hypothetical protein JSV80_13210 [Acidobacteriota bacterium]